MPEAEVYELLYRILSRIKFVAEEFVASENKLQAFNLCKDIDEDDIPFIALSIQLDAPLWTGDKRLKESSRASHYFSKVSFSAFRRRMFGQYPHLFSASVPRRSKV